MPSDRGEKKDHLRRKWQWAEAQWEVAKETGVVDESRRQTTLPHIVPEKGKRVMSWQKPRGDETPPDRD